MKQIIIKWIPRDEAVEWSRFLAVFQLLKHDMTENRVVLRERVRLDI